MKLSKTLKAKWLEALRSGKYVQGRLYLRQIGAGQGRFCCLGVCADISGGRWEMGMHRYTFKPDSWNGGEWYARLPKSMLADSAQATLIEMNDRGDSFAQIADWIEANL